MATASIAGVGFNERYRDNSPESSCSCCSCSCSYRSLPSSVSSCDCSDLIHSSNSCSCTCSNCCYPSSSTSSPPPINACDAGRRPRRRGPLVVRHRTGRTPVRVPEKPRIPSERTKLKKPPKDVESLMTEFKLAKKDAFALELGYRLHEALKLEHEAKKIERQIDSFHQMKRSPSRSREAVKVLTPSRKSGSTTPKTTPKTVRRSQSKSPAKTVILSPRSVGSVRLDDLENIMNRSTSLESFLIRFSGESIPAETKKKLKIMETKHKLMINNMKTELGNKETKSGVLLKEAVDTVFKKSDLLKREIERLNRLKEKKMNEVDLLDQNFVIKEYRSKKAKIHQMVNEYHREMASKFLAVRSKQDNLIRDEFQERMKDEKKEVFRVKRLLKEKEDVQYIERKKFLEAFDGMYQSKFEAVKEKLNEVNQETRARKKNNTQLLNEIKERLKHKLSMV